MGLHPLSKLNAPGLSVRKCMKLLMMMLHGRVEGSCKSHSMTMCSQVWTSALPHRQLVGRWGKNLCLYSPIGACSVVIQMNWAYSEFVKPMKGSHDSCHDLAKWLSHYLYFFSFLFFCFYLGLTTQKRVWKSVTSQVSQSHDRISHDWSHDRRGKIVHRPCSSCISSEENLTGTLSKSLCQSPNKEQLALF